MEEDRGRPHEHQEGQKQEHVSVTVRGISRPSYDGISKLPVAPTIPCIGYHGEGAEQYGEKERPQCDDDHLVDIVKPRKEAWQTKSWENVQVKDG